MATQARASTPSITVTVAKRERARPRGAPALIATVLRHLLLIVLAFTFLLPLYWMASSALKDDSQVYTIPPVWIPRRP